MDIGPRAFLHQLPTILNAIADAHFVAIDLELSGIPTRKLRAAGEDNSKPNLQSRYEETRMAAEKYQVLQLGITCVEEDKDKGTHAFHQSSNEAQIDHCQAFTLLGHITSLSTLSLLKGLVSTEFFHTKVEVSLRETHASMKLLS